MIYVRYASDVKAKLKHIIPVFSAHLIQLDSHEIVAHSSSRSSSSLMRRDIRCTPQIMASNHVVPRTYPIAPNTGSMRYKASMYPEVTSSSR